MMRLGHCLLAGLLGVITTVASAAPVFSCMTESRKIIEVTKTAANEFVYSYGPKGKLELVFKSPRKAVFIDLGNGIGRYRSYSLVMRNGPATYTVFFNRDSLSAERPDAGVEAAVGTSVRTVNCSKKYPMDEFISSQG